MSAPRSVAVVAAFLDNGFLASPVQGDHLTQQTDGNELDADDDEQHSGQKQGDMLLKRSVQSKLEVENITIDEKPSCEGQKSQHAEQVQGLFHKAGGEQDGNEIEES